MYLTGMQVYMVMHAELWPETRVEHELLAELEAASTKRLAVHRESIEGFSCHWLVRDTQYAAHKEHLAHPDAQMLYSQWELAEPCGKQARVLPHIPGTLVTHTFLRYV